MSLYAFIGALETGLAFALVALGAYLTFRVLDFPDLTVEGSFPLGAAVCAKLMISGVDPWMATLVASLVGCVAGFATAFLNLKLRILHILAGILTAIALYSINLRIMDRPNIGLINMPTVYTPFEHLGIPSLYAPVVLLAIIVVIVKILIDLFLATGFGLAMRAAGANARMARANGIRDGRMIVVGLAIANGITALSGALFAQMLGAADVSMGIGVIVVALAGVIGGTALMPSRLIPMLTLACVLGSILYRLALALALSSNAIGLTASDVNVVTAVLVAIALWLPVRNAAFSRREMIKVENLGVTFNKGTMLENRALHGVNLSIAAGEFVTVIGSNGAGKSTFLNLLAGEFIPSTGRISIDGTDVTYWPVYRRATMLARMFQDPRAGICEEMSIIENIAIAAARTSPRGFGFAITRQVREQANERLAMLQLGLEKRLHDRVALLSGGQRQALALIMATLGTTKVLLLDEHTAALDPAAAELVLNLTGEIVKKFGITTVMVTHSMRQALELGSRTIMLHHGQIILDIAGEQRASMTIEQLVQMFRRKEGAEISDDQLLLA